MQPTTLTGEQTYKNDFATGQRTTLPTRQPNASCFNFFTPAQKILKFFGSHTGSTFAVAPNRTKQPEGNRKRAAFFPPSKTDKIKMVFLFNEH